MLPCKQRLFQGHPCLFQQDNAKPHSAGVTAVWLCSKRVRVLYWPACSPALSPNWKCVAHYEEQNTTTETPDCWTTEVVHQARMGTNSTASTISVVSSQTLIECCLKERWCNTGLNIQLSQLFWNVLQASNWRWANICKKTKLISLNIKYLVFVESSIEYKLKRNCKSLFSIFI